MIRAMFRWDEREVLARQADTRQEVMLSHPNSYVHVCVRMAEWSKAPDSSSGLRKRAWVQIPLLTFFALIFILTIFALI